MDRKNEFGNRVDAIEQALLGGGGRALLSAAAVLAEDVRELRDRLLSGDQTAVDEALDFLEIRRPVYHVGYSQEKLARSLKAATLDGSQVGRLEFLVIQLVTSSLQGGQLRELVRALRGRATETFRLQLLELKSGNSTPAARRASRALSVLAAAAQEPIASVSRSERPRKHRPTNG